MAIARYTLAVDRGFKRGGDSSEQTADFIPCVAFDKAGEFAERYFNYEKYAEELFDEGYWFEDGYVFRDE